MTKHYLAEFVLASRSGVPANNVVNTFSVIGPDAPTPTQFDHLEAAIFGFYNVAQTGQTNALYKYLSHAINQSGHALHIYERPSAPGSLGSPVKSYVGMGFDNDTIGSIPEEVACCLSLLTAVTAPEVLSAIDTAIPSDESAIDQGAPTTHSGHDRPASRVRGRLYLGPFNSGVLATDSNGRSEPSAAFRTDVLADATALPGNLGADWGWEVFSKRSWSGNLVTHGYVDDAWDTQRRRGMRATTRSTFVVP